MFIRRTLRNSIIVAMLAGLLATFATASAQTTLGGSVTFRDSAAQSDSLVIALTGIPVPAAGTALEGWLLTTNGTLSVGVLGVDPTGAANHTYVSPSGANLLATYSSFAISEEPTPDSDPATPGPYVYADSIPAGAFLNTGHLLATWSSNPAGKGIVVGLREQTGVALDHALLANISTTLGSAQNHSHHVVNIIEGSAGDNYDVSFTDPGDGIGILNYAADAIVHANLAKDVASDNTTVVANADGVIATANNVIAWATLARDNALTVIAATTLDTLANLSIDNAVTNLTQALEGRDSDANGVIAAIANEGGAWQAYWAAQDIALFMPTEGETPSVGDTQVPMIALSLLLAGLAFTAAGGFVLLRRRAVRA